MVKVLIFDGDDTLWSTEQLYDEARREARRAVESYGLDGARWEEIERERDVENVARLGMTSERFPTSCVEALDELVAAGCGRAPAWLREAVSGSARRVFTSPAPLVDGARDVLAQLASSHTLVLLTKGDARVQARRVETSGLAPLLQRIEIVPEKSASTFRELAQSLGADPQSAVSIGNSLGSDIWPAVEAGMSAIWIDAHVWEYERSRGEVATLPQGAIVAASLAEVPAAIERLVTCR